MPHPVTKSIKHLGVTAVEFAHPLGAVALRGPDQQVVVISQETVRVAAPVTAVAHRFCKVTRGVKRGKGDDGI